MERYDFLVQLGLAVLLGGIIGLEREVRGKPAGLRTNILIALGATMFTRLSVYMAGDHGDPARIAAQILTGIGFLGAGVILHTMGSVTGVTTAATIWVVAAIGMAVGVSAYVEAVASSLVVMVVLAGVDKLELILEKRLAHRHFIVTARSDAGTLKTLARLAAATGVEIERQDTSKEKDDLVVQLDVRGPKTSLDQLVVLLVQEPSVRGVRAAE